MDKRKNVIWAMAANAGYLSLFGISAILFDQPLFTSSGQPLIHMTNGPVLLIQLISAALIFIIYWRLAEILREYKEATWVWISLYINLLFQLYFKILNILSLFEISVNFDFYRYSTLANLAGLTYAMVASLCVKNSAFKSYYRLFSVMTLISVLSISISAFYSTSSSINPGGFKIIPYFATLFLFIKYYRTSIKPL